MQEKTLPKKEEEKNPIRLKYTFQKQKLKGDGMISSNYQENIPANQEFHTQLVCKSNEY